jgi:hypothetical protein
MFNLLPKFCAERHDGVRPALARPLALATIVAVLAAVALPAQAQFAPKIPLAKLQAMFATMRAQGRVNVDGPLRWGYFFLDPDRAKLDAIAADLRAKGYRVVGIARINGRNLYRLHVERVELLTAESLYARDIELETLVRKFHVLSYDGMDVGPAPAAASAASR